MLKAEWNQVVADYNADQRFQYFPHAHVGTANFPKVVAVLATFEGHQWSDTAVMTALRQAHLSTGMGAGGRMIRKATENLGFCWFDNHVLWMTPAGNDMIEAGLILIRRQHRIEVGAIDLYCRSENGELVVVELKKVRASDKVFGQLCRYIGCIRAKHAAANQSVRGYIIGSAIDEKLRYAATVAPPGTVRLKTFRRDPANAAIFVEE